MTATILIPIALCISFLLGSIPTGYWLGLVFKKKNIREEGSGNIGATNTMRILGKGYGITALVFDVFKGWVAVVLIARLHGWEYLPVACGLAAILGHTFSIFVRFRGGKGVATSAGVFIGLAPSPTIIAGAVLCSVVITTRMVSAGSVAAATALAVSVFFFDLSWPVRIFTVIVAVLIILRHQSNIQRIWRNEESKL